MKHRKHLQARMAKLNESRCTAIQAAERFKALGNIGISAAQLNENILRAAEKLTALM